MNCDRIARWYRWLEYAACGRALERRRSEYLNATADAKRVLMLGDGDGRFLAEFVQRSQHSRVDSIELSGEMMRLQAGRVSAHEHLNFHHADARSVTLAPGVYDLVVTHFFLDCFSTVETAELIERVSRAASAHARWLISEFHQPTNGFAFYWVALFIRAAYAFFRLTTGLAIDKLPNYREALEANGFKRKEYQLATGGLLISELWERT